MKILLDPAAMTIDDAAHGRQADSSSFECGRAVQTLKRGKQLLRVVHIETNDVVAQEIGILGRTRRCLPFENAVTRSR